MKSNSTLPLDARFFKVITDSIAPATVIILLTILVGISLIFERFYKEMIILILTVLPVVIGSYLKKKIGKPRPTFKNPPLVKEKSYSFPSTHSGVSISLYGFLAYLCIVFSLSNTIFIGAILLAFLICYSRRHLRIHDFIDISAGILLGLLNLSFLIYLYDTFSEKYFPKSVLLLLIIISWIFIIIYYKKHTDEIPKFLIELPKIPKRIITGVIIAIISLGAISIGGKTFIVFMILVLAAGIFEIISVNKEAGKTPLRIFALVVLLIYTVSIIAERNFEFGKYYVLIFVLTSIFSDTFGWAIGKKYGKTKIQFLEKISPNKTIEGYAAAIIAPILIVGTVLLKYSKLGYYSYLLVAILTLAAISGDLSESQLKRKLGIKDASDMLGSHGGVLDRVDSNLTAGFVMYLIVMILTHVFHITIF